MKRYPVLLNGEIVFISTSEQESMSAFFTFQAFEYLSTMRRVEDSEYSIGWQLSVEALFFKRKEIVSQWVEKALHLRSLNSRTRIVSEFFTVLESEMKERSRNQ